MPYAVQVGQQIAQLYLRLGEATGNADDTRTGLDLLKSEIDRYAQNVVYYQSLSPVQYSTLPRNDMFIDRYHFMDLIEDYGYSGGDIEALQDELTARGVNLNRQVAFREAQERAAQQK